MSQEISIIIIDDDEIDVMAIRKSLKLQRVANDVFEASDGVEALELLRGENGKVAPKKPWLILLDLNMPRMDGKEFLAEVRKDPNLAKSVIFVLTTSKDEVDIEETYRKNIAGYMVKGEAGRDFLDAIGMVSHFWKIVELPEDHP